MHRTMSPSKKYAVWNPAKDKTIVELLLSDDEKKILTVEQRQRYLERVEKKYKAAVKKRNKGKEPSIEEQANELLRQFEEKNKLGVMTTIAKITMKG